MYFLTLEKKFWIDAPDATNSYCHSIVKMMTGKRSYDQAPCECLGSYFTCESGARGVSGVLLPG